MRWFQDEAHMKNELVLINAFTLMNNGKDFFLLSLEVFAKSLLIQIE
jgi:hypothetical protein